MGIFSKFEGRVEDTFEGAANKMFDSPISPVQIAKKAEKQMRREKMVGAGKQYAPTLYTVLVNPDDDQRLFGYYPTLAGETETYLSAKAVEAGFVMDGQPLVRFIVDDGLKRGKFDVVAELVSAPIISQLRVEEFERYGFTEPSQEPRGSQYDYAQDQGFGQSYSAPSNQQERYANQQYPSPRPDQFSYQDSYSAPGQDSFYGQEQSPASYGQAGYSEEPYVQPKPPLPYVPENEIDYSIDYGEYTFNSQDFEDHQSAVNALEASGAYSASKDHPALQIPSIEDTPGQRAELNREAQQPGALHPDVVPNTVVFAQGRGNAQPAPNNRMVQARLMNTTDNKVYDLATARLLLGREQENDIVVNDINASRTHAELRLEPQGVWCVSDLGSTNGTLVNGVEVTSHPLRDGDYITIGMTNYVFMQP